MGTTPGELVVEAPAAGDVVAARTSTGRGSERTYHRPAPPTVMTTSATSPPSSARDSPDSRSRSVGSTPLYGRDRPIGPAREEGAAEASRKRDRPLCGRSHSGCGGGAIGRNRPIALRLGNREVEVCSPAWRLVHADGPAVGLDQAAGDVQPEPGAWLLGLLPQAAEPVEHLRPAFLGDTRALVANAHGDGGRPLGED